MSLPPNLRPWSISPEAFPRDGSLSEQARFLVGYAILAPSSHNTQPWRFVPQDDGVLVLRDRSRQLPVADPVSRELHISLGAAIKAYCVAAERFGLAFDVAIQPEGEGSDVVARISLAPGGTCADSTRRLFPFLTTRQTTRLRMAPNDLSELARQDVRVALSDLLDIEFELITEEHTREEIAELSVAASLTLFADPAYRQELAAWMRSNGSSAGDGMPGRAFGLNWLASLLMPRVVRSMSPETHAARSLQLVQEAPMLAVIGTEGDSVPDWILAGGALMQLSLAAAACHLSLGFHSEVIACDETREHLRQRLYNEDVHPHVLVRLGHSVSYGPTPRRPLEEVLGMP